MFAKSVFRETYIPIYIFFSYTFKFHEPMHRHTHMKAFWRFFHEGFMCCILPRHRLLHIAILHARMHTVSCNATYYILNSLQCFIIQCIMHVIDVWCVYDVILHTTRYMPHIAMLHNALCNAASRGAYQSPCCTLACIITARCNSASRSLKFCIPLVAILHPARWNSASQS